MAIQAHITKENLARIVGQLLVNPESVGELDSSESFMCFMSDVAQAVCDHCGGEVSSLAEMQDGSYQLEIKRNDSSPGEGLGIWETEKAAGESLARPASVSQLTEPGQSEVLVWDAEYFWGFKISVSDRQADGSVSFEAEEWRNGSCFKTKACGSYEEAHHWVDENISEHTRVRFGLDASDLQEFG